MNNSQPVRLVGKSAGWAAGLVLAQSSRTAGASAAASASFRPPYGPTAANHACTAGHSPGWLELVGWLLQPSHLFPAGSAVYLCLLRLLWAIVHACQLALLAPIVSPALHMYTILRFYKLPFISFFFKKILDYM